MKRMVSIALVVAKYFSVSQPTICYREKRILQKLKRLMEE